MWYSMAYRIVKDDKTGNSIVVPKVTKFVYKAKLLDHIDQNSKLVKKSETQNTDVEIEIVSLPENTVIQEPIEKEKDYPKQQIFKCQEWGFNFDVPTLAHIATKKIDPEIVQIETQKRIKILYFYTSTNMFLKYINDTILVSVSNIFGFLGFYVPFMYLPSLVQTNKDISGLMIVRCVYFIVEVNKDTMRTYECASFSSTGFTIPSCTSLV